MTERPRECGELLELLLRIQRKILNDLSEALLRTPPHISSRPYIERSYRLARSGLEALVEALKRGGC